MTVGLVADADQRDGFHRFFFIEPPSPTPAALDPAGRLVPDFMPRHTIGTLWQHRILRRAFWVGGQNARSTLLQSLTTNPTAFGLVFESIVLDDIRLGQVTQGYQIIGHPSPTPLHLPSRLAELAPGYCLTLTGDFPFLTPSSSYFIPVDLSFPTIDAVIITSTEVILL
jgi:hypothetical protein